MNHGYPQHVIPHPHQQDNVIPQVGDTKKLSEFLADLFTIGSLKGFQHFELYLCGREELLLRVNNQREVSPTKRGFSSAFQIAKTQKATNLSHKTQRLLRATTLGPTLPATIPLDHELNQTQTTFLIAGYARYKRPYVWLRSNHKKLLKLEIDPTKHKDGDNPLKLVTISDWRSKETKVWDIISEVILLTQEPPPTNPFAVDHDYFDSLPVEESVFATGALISVLQKIYLSNFPYADQVMNDIKQLHQRHYTDFGELVEFQFMHKQQPKLNGHRF
ncbi:hypothetical protein K7432_000720 [Basidiobolus ranarum]|uniref:DUF7886 domain-containing protein n=1 Tax=Basidiobolus ranarum TaxID=34480 RepID=A0ABR2WAU3_9FUNG